MSLPRPRQATPLVALALLSLSLAACDDAATLDPSHQPLEAVSFAGGIPIGTFALPNSEFGDRYNGAHRNILPADLLSALAAQCFATEYVYVESADETAAVDRLSAPGAALDAEQLAILAAYRPLHRLELAEQAFAQAPAPEAVRGSRPRGRRTRVSARTAPYAPS